MPSSDPLTLSEPLQDVGEIGGVAASPGLLEVVVVPSPDAEDVVLADIETRVNECFRTLQQALQVNVVDIDGAVCFALQGDDLLYVER